MKVYRIELLVVDHEGWGENAIRMELENSGDVYANVISVAERDLESWDDDHPLNKHDTMIPEFRRLFGG